MLSIHKLFLSSVLLSLGLLAFGCGSAKRIQSSEIPDKPMSNETVPASVAERGHVGHYFVQKHDCLWAIAGQPRVYGDPFEWPILFKANRDEIKDPDLIYPRQDLRVEKEPGMEEAANAKRLAAATPKYVPHSKPRETLPVNYF